ncbi:MAG: GAF domain-containing protein [Anaerolineae bacterium]|nr:GAF domain-containing protein [Anaerolineae bacterium]
MTVAGFVQENFGVLETAVKLSNPATISETARLEVLDSLLGLQPAFRNLVLFDAEGRDLAKISDISTLSSEEFVAQLRKDGVTQVRQRYIGPVDFDPVASEPFAVMAVPALDVFKEFCGTLAAEVNLKFMWEVVDQIKVGESGQAYVVDRQGNLIAFRESGRVLREDNVASLRVVDEFIHSSTLDAGTIRGISKGIDGTWVVATYVPLGTPDWAVVVEMPWGEAYRETFVNIVYSLLVMLLVSVGALLIGRIRARWLASPLVDLTGVATRIAEGSLYLEASVVGPYEEVVRLAEAFNSMTRQLRSSIGNLEERVLDRTRRLESIATIGEQLNTILDPDDLLRLALRQITQHFGYERADIYLFDASGEILSVVSGGVDNSSVTTSGLIPSADTGLVMQVARERRIVRVGLPSSASSDLPSSTRVHAEMAVPIMQKSEVLGVLSVHADQAGALDDNDASLLRSLANQIAVALSNARLFGQVRHSKEEAEKAKEHAEEARLQVESQMWHAAGQAQLSERIAGSQGIPSLANNVIKQLCQYLQIQVGALYVMEDGVLRLQGRYAYSGQSDFHDRFTLNEGLVGEAAAGKQKYWLSNIPQDVLALQSGFGEIALRCSVAAPFIYESQVVGVVELGSLQEFTSAQLQFIEAAMERIGVAFSTALARAQVDELLARTQQMAEELQAQSDELLVANEELASQTESLSRSEGQLREKQALLESVNTELEEKAIVLQEQQDILNRQNLDLKITQDELERKAQELTQANKYKSEFLANMSHELRTPLNSMLILAGMLRRSEAENLREDQIESLSLIYDSGRDLLDLINEILDLSKIEAGRMEFHFEPLVLSDLADAMLSHFKPMAEQRGLEFALHMAEDLPDQIVGDVQRVGQVVKNLLANAFKFTEHGGVYLSIHRPQQLPDSMASNFSPEQMVAISVRDTGIGIQDDKQEIIFEAFQQADGSTSRKYGGTGLGLSICRELAFRMGGAIDMSSVPGQGSTFTFYLPETWSNEDVERLDSTRDMAQMGADSPALPETLLPQEEPSRPTAFSDDRDQIVEGDRVLLIIADDITFARMVCDQARRRAFKCLFSGDGEGGLSLVEMHHPKAILLELCLPGMSGWTVLQQLKDDPNTRHIPVHVVSDEKRMLDAYKRGAMGFSTKPVSAEDLAKVLNKMEQFVACEVKSHYLCTLTE